MKLTPTHIVVLAALEKYGPMTVRQLAEKCKLNYKSFYNGVPNCMEVLRQRGFVHIGSWQRAEGRGGLPRPIYAHGEGEDAPRPVKKTYAEKMVIFKKWRKRQSVAKKYEKEKQRSKLAFLLGV